MTDLELRQSCFRLAGPHLQPFAPNREWKNARVFIVGLNPIAPLREEFQSFEDYWESLTSTPSKYIGQTRNNLSATSECKSRTTKRIIEMVSHLYPLNILVTNVIAYPSLKPELIPKEIRLEPYEKRVITKLIHICRPKVIFFHGREATKYANKIFDVDLNPYVHPMNQGTLAQIPNSHYKVWLYAYHHLVGRVDKGNVVSERIKQFSARIRAHFS